MPVTLAACFPQYTDHDPTVPIWCATPGEGRVFHRFFDTSPFSPSGRYLGLTRLPYEDRLPAPGDPAQVVIVDLAAGGEEVVAETRGWDTQLGAQVQWGADDTQLFFNDLETGDWRPHGVKLDPLSGERLDLQGAVYMVSPDGAQAASPCLLRTGATQAGYGVVVPPDCAPRNHGAPDDDGLFVTDTATGDSRLLISLREIVETATPTFDPELFRDGDFYGFHVKYNSRGDRLMFVVRWLPHEAATKRLNAVVTMGADGADPRVAIPAEIWAKGGHHPNWCPDGETVMINLGGYGKGLRLVRARYDGADLEPLHADLVGSGHPTLHPDGRHVVTDAYVREPVAYGDGTTPIRWLDLATGQETTIARVRTRPPYEGPRHELRVDPHPAWDRDHRWIAFNACPDGTRRVYVADLSALLDS